MTSSVWLLSFTCRQGASILWSSLPPQILDPRFTLEHCREALRRRSRSPLKSILLDQSWFPGIGNWMADEISLACCFTSHPSGGSIRGSAPKSFFNKTIKLLGMSRSNRYTDWGTPPTSWLFPHRWNDGGICPVQENRLFVKLLVCRTTLLPNSSNFALQTLSA